MKPISVVIPAHNAAGTIERALRSVFCQEVAPLDIVVVDDCSDDATAAVVTRFADMGVRLISLGHCHGAAAARNAGIRAAWGELVAFLDADDEWLPGKLAKQAALLAANPRALLVSCGSLLIAPDGRNLGNVYADLVPVTGPDAWRRLLACNFITTPSVLTYRETLLEVGGFDPALRVAEDQDMWLKLCMRGDLAYVDEYLVLVHMQPNSLSARNPIDDQLTYTLPMIMRHLEARRADLSRRQRNQILGFRLSRLGRAACGLARPDVGIDLLFRAVMLGHKPLENLCALAKAMPPVRWLKPWLRKAVGVPGQALRQ
jgi:glycosyltransferase involved in cell wall biosynthesis